MAASRSWKRDDDAPEQLARPLLQARRRRWRRPRRPWRRRSARRRPRRRRCARAGPRWRGRAASRAAGSGSSRRRARRRRASGRRGGRAGRSVRSRSSRSAATDGVGQLDVERAGEDAEAAGRPRARRRRAARSTTSMAARRLRWRSGCPAAGPSGALQHVEARVMRASSSAGASARARAAASSMARGRPSSWRHSSPTAEMVSGVRLPAGAGGARPGRGTAAPPGDASTSTSPWAGRAASARGRARLAPRAARGWWPRPAATGAARLEHRATNSAAPSSTCSQLSSTRTASAPRRLAAAASGEANPTSALTAAASAPARRGARLADDRGARRSRIRRPRTTPPVPAGSCPSRRGPSRSPGRRRPSCVGAVRRRQLDPGRSTARPPVWRGCQAPA